MQALEQALPWRERLALAAALEYLTALVSRQALRGEGWLVGGASRQARLWRWHCAEELAHHGVALRLLREAGRVGYARRMGLYVLASLILLGDVARHTRDFARTDRARGWLGRGGGVLSLAGFALRQGPGLGRMAVGWLAYALPLRWLVSQAGGPQGGDAAARIEVRLLRNEDIPRLLVLERKKWDDTQAASAQAMAERIAAHPALCLGAFCPRTGEALASLFLKPISLAQLQHARSWADCVAPAGPGGATPCRDLFGISLSSISAEGVDAIFAFFWPRALQAGWRHIYLGSPVPGLARWQARQPGGPGCVERYVRAVRAGLPQDPQLRYYWRKGFRTIVACKPGYFPHPESLDHGVVLRGRIPLSFLAPVWRRLPLRWLQGLGRHVFAVL